MTCNVCRATIEINNTGICLGCPRGIRGVQQEDSWEHAQEKKRRQEIDETNELKKKIAEAEAQLDSIPIPVARTVNKTPKKSTRRKKLKS